MVLVIFTYLFSEMCLSKKQNAPPPKERSATIRRAARCRGALLPLSPPCPGTVCITRSDGHSGSRPRAHTAMAVVIASNGIIKTKLFRCDFLLNPELLTVFDKAFNEIFSGMKLSSVNRPFIQTAAARLGELSMFTPGVLVAIMEACETAKEVSVYLSGVTKPLFMSDVNFLNARNVMEFLNNRHDLAEMLENLPLDTSVSIGGENSRTELAGSAVISTRYRLDDNPSGVLAVIAPVRTDYARAISILECVSESVSTLIDELIEI